MAINVPQLQGYMGAGFNVLITGEAGTGKTAMLKQAAANLNWNMKYFSAATMDPIIDLIGIPVPDTDKQVMNFYRPEDIEDADVIFVDELNRAPVPVLNSVFELIQFRSVNGRHLPKLKCVVAAINPVTSDYTTDELDRALTDRFDVFLSSEVEADYQYLKSKFGPAYAKVGVQLFKEYQENYKTDRSKGNSMGYFSPRRLEKLMEVFQKFPTPETVRAVLPSDVIVPAKAVAVNFNDALRASVEQDKGAAAARAAMAGVSSADQVQVQLAKSAADLRSRKNVGAYKGAYGWAKDNDPAAAQRLLSALATALNRNVGPDTIATVWGEAVRDFSPSQVNIMMRGWDRYKIANTKAKVGLR